VQGGDRRDGVDAVGQVVEPVDRDDAVLGTRALPAAVTEAVAPDTVTHSETDGTGPRLGDRADHVAADHERERRGRGVRAGPDEGVHRVDGDRVGAHEDIGRSGTRPGQLPGTRRRRAARAG
jgi:hypothetical protein